MSNQSLGVVPLVQSEKVFVITVHPYQSWIRPMGPKRDRTASSLATLLLNIEEIHFSIMKGKFKMLTIINDITNERADV